MKLVELTNVIVNEYTTLYIDNKFNVSLDKVKIEDINKCKFKDENVLWVDILDTNDIVITLDTELGGRWTQRKEMK
jgi:hypothetical protein